jgi:hypothetical protein
MSEDYYQLKNYTSDAKIFEKQLVENSGEYLFYP